MKQPSLRDDWAEILRQQWATAYKAGQNGKMLAQLITEPIIEDAALNKLNIALKKRLPEKKEDLSRGIGNHLASYNLGYNDYHDAVLNIIEGEG